MPCLYKYHHLTSARLADLDRCRSLVPNSCFTIGIGISLLLQSGQREVSECLRRILDRVFELRQLCRVNFENAFGFQLRVNSPCKQVVFHISCKVWLRVGPYRRRWRRGCARSLVFGSFSFAILEIVNHFRVDESMRRSFHNFLCC